MRYVLRIAGVAFVALAIPAAGVMLLGRLGLFAGAGASIAFLLWVWFWLPRFAHLAFDAGAYKQALRRYRALRSLATSTVRERHALLSMIGCRVAMGDSVDDLLASIDGSALDAAEKAVWLNNRAMAVVAKDPAAALALSDEATALRPDVPALQHTRAMALLAIGRIDDAIKILDGMRAGGELPPRLEADRCRDLATGWQRKGETAYAEDYRLRAAALSAR